MSSIELAGVRVDAIDERGVIARVLDDLSAGRGGTVVTLNVHHLFQTQRIAALRDASARAHLAVADGRPLLWAARLAGSPLPGQVAGSSLLWSLSAAAATAHQRVYLLGGNSGAADATARMLVTRFPELVIAGVTAPQVDIDDNGALGRVAREVAGARPDIVFSAFGAPKQEIVNERLYQELPRTWFVGVGGAFSMAAGHVRRSPPWMSRMGAEWVFRLAQEPRRLARRYVVQDLPFALRLLAASLRQRQRDKSG